MFVRRIAGPSRLSTQFACNHGYTAYRNLGKRYMSRKGGARAANALVDPNRGKDQPKGVAGIEAMKEQGEQAERMGTRGQERRSMDEVDLPTMDVFMLPPRDGKKLYFPRYGLKIYDWPIFARWSWDPLLAIVDPRRWTLRGIGSIFSRLFRMIGASAFGIIRSGRWLNPFKLRSNILAARIAAAQRIVEARNEGPKALELYRKRLANERANFKAMSLIASKQKFPEWIFGYHAVAERRVFSVDRFRQRKQRREEDRFFSDLSSSQSPLRSILRDARHQYIEMNKAISRGEKSDLRLYAGKSYLRDIQDRAENVKKESREVDRQWKFERWIRQPVCLSIRANDPLSGFNRSLVSGDRLYVNMLVKFESLQSMTVTQAPHRGKLRTGQPSQKKTITRPITEYLVLDVRTWVQGRMPKFIQEVYEGQELAITQSAITQEEMLGLKKENKDEAEKSTVAAATTATTGSTPSLA